MSKGDCMITNNYDMLNAEAIKIIKEKLYIEFDDKSLLVRLKDDELQEYDYTIIFCDNPQEYEILKRVLSNE